MRPTKSERADRPVCDAQLSCFRLSISFVARNWLARGLALAPPARRAGAKRGGTQAAGGAASSSAQLVEGCCACPFQRAARIACGIASCIASDVDERGANIMQKKADRRWPGSEGRERALV